MDKEEKKEPTFEEELDELCKKHNVTLDAVARLVPSHGGAFVIKADLRKTKIDR